MTTHRILAALALTLLPGLPLLGYLWPPADAPAPQTAQDPWTWPAAKSAAQPAPPPANLALFWPGAKPAPDTDSASNAAANKQTGAHRDWTLIGLIRQGNSLTALVQDPQQNILTLRPGDRLDQERRVSTLEPTRLHWQDNQGRTGQLQLYPAPTSD